MRKLETLSHLQREATPKPFASFLIQTVRTLLRSETVAVLWIQKHSVYREFEGVDLWDKERNARLYDGSYPIVAHPPCGPWGKFKWKCRNQSKLDGAIAMAMVHMFGGIVEQPIGSSLFDEHGRGGAVWKLNQYDYGHLAQKRTLLYVYPPVMEGGLS